MAMKVIEPFQVFVNLDLHGKKTRTISDLTSATTVAELKKKIQDREAGAKDIMLHFQAKPLRDELTLGDYGMAHGSQVFAAVRRAGGAQATGEESTRSWCHESGKKLSVEPVTTDCELSTICGGDTDGPPRAKLPCGHVICSGCAFDYYDRSVNIQALCDVKCHNSTSCKQVVDHKIWFVVGGLSTAEQTTFEVQLGKNAVESGAHGLCACPVYECGGFLSLAEGYKEHRVDCPFCKKSFCRVCRAPWKSSTSTWYGCGNACTDAAKKVAMLINCDKITIDYGAKKWTGVPSIRLCPHCSFTMAHGGGCHKMTCSGCAQMFCHVCTRVWGDGGCSYSATCSVAPVQEIV